MAWTATTSFETTDGSTTPTDGNDLNGTGTGDGSGWSGGWSGGTDFDYENALAFDGTWSVTSGANVDQQIFRAMTTALVSGFFAVNMRFDSTLAHNFGVQLQSTTTRAQDIFLNLGTSFRAPTDNAGWTGTANLAVDTWYKIGVDFDCTTDTSDIYINDTLIKTGANFLTAVTTINRVYFRNARSSAGTPRCWWDYIREGTPVAPTAGTTTVPTLALMGVG